MRIWYSSRLLSPALTFQAGFIATSSELLSTTCQSPPSSDCEADLITIARLENFAFRIVSGNVRFFQSAVTIASIIHIKSFLQQSPTLRVYCIYLTPFHFACCSICNPLLKSPYLRGILKSQFIPHITYFFILILENWSDLARVTNEDDLDWSVVLKHEEIGNYGNSSHRVFYIYFSSLVLYYGYQNSHSSLMVTQVNFAFPSTI